jgi:hypothetical protein
MTALEIVGLDEELAVAHDSAVEAGETAFRGCRSATPVTNRVKSS